MIHRLRFDRKLVAAWAACALLLLSASSVHAQQRESTPSAQQLQPEAKQEQGRFGMNREEHQAYRLEVLKEAAEYFNISTEGKSTAELHKEVKAARAANKEKWEQFKQEQTGKRLTRLQKIASDLGIKTEGKTAKQLHAEIRALCETKQRSKERQKSIS